MLVPLKRIVITAMLFLMSTVSAGPTLASDPSASFKMSRLPSGSMAAPFELTTLDGKVVKSSELAGKVVVVNFWATWCGPCKEEMPSIGALTRAVGPDALRATDCHDGSATPGHHVLSVSVGNQSAGALR